MLDKKSQQPISIDPTEGSGKRETKIEKFKRLFKHKINNKKWISKDEMAELGFFPLHHSNGRDIRFIKKVYELEIEHKGTREIKFRVISEKGNKYSRAISRLIYKELSKKPCVWTGTYSDIEIDHKNGRYNDARVLNTKTQTIDDFQPLTKVMNNRKREACKKCAATNQKFNAKTLGFTISTLDGEIEYKEGTNGCVGCFFYDIDYFKEKHIEYLCNRHNCSGCL